MTKLILLLIFAGFGYAFYLIIKEGLCEQLSKIDKIQTRINAYTQQQKENTNETSSLRKSHLQPKRYRYD